MDVAGRRGQEKEEGHDKSDRCSCDSSASQLFQKRTYTTTHAYIVILYIHTHVLDTVCASVLMCITKCIDHFICQLRAYCVPKSMGIKWCHHVLPWQLPCTLSRRRKKGKSGRRRKPKKRQGRWNRWNANSLFSVRYTLPETSSEFTPEI